MAGLVSAGQLVSCWLLLRFVVIVSTVLCTVYTTCGTHCTEDRVKRHSSNIAPLCVGGWHTVKESQHSEVFL